MSDLEKILEEIKDMEDMEISAVQNEWYFKCLLREEMLQNSERER